MLKEWACWLVPPLVTEAVVAQCGLLSLDGKSSSNSYSIGETHFTVETRRKDRQISEPGATHFPISSLSVIYLHVFFLQRSVCLAVMKNTATVISLESASKSQKHGNLLL